MKYGLYLALCVVVGFLWAQVCRDYDLTFSTLMFGLLTFAFIAAGDTK